MPTSRRTFVGQLLQYMRQVLKDGGEAVGSRWVTLSPSERMRLERRLAALRGGYYIIKWPVQRRASGRPINGVFESGITGREYSGKDAVMRGHDAELLPGSELDK